MPRKPRAKSATGMYHVMLRGINKQNIFIYKEDFEQMQWALVEAQRQRTPDGRIANSDECTIFAYCILNNHVHILIREGNKSISQIMQKIEDRFVYFYNKRYDRVGHLFQARFRSEPVNDVEYFHILLRYIHRNPVVAMECDRPEDYSYSSWPEYLSDSNNEIKVILPRAFKTVYTYFKPTELIEYVSMDVHDDCMDMTTERFVHTDSHAWAILSDISQEKNIQDFMSLPPDIQLQYITEAIKSGVSLRQASRMSSLTFYAIKKYYDAQEIRSKISIKGSDPLIEKLNINALNNDRMKQIMALMDDAEEIGSGEVSEALGVSDSLARRLLRKMVDGGLLCVVGSTKRKKYRLMEDGKG